MKKVFKNKIIQNGLFFIIGAVIFGGVGVLATTYVLQSSEIQYTNDKSVQQAIDELYLKAENCGKGSSETLPVGDVSVKSLTVKVPYTGTYKDIKCLYGTTESYGKRGTVDNNTCTFMGTSGSQTIYYKIIASNDDGKIYENSGSATTGTETNVIVTDIPKGTKAIIYLDPTDLSATCNESNSTIGSGTSGCMKWYAFKEDDTSYTMILDHKTSSSAWNSSNGSTIKEAQSSLENDTSGWSGSPRLITMNEVINIEGVSATSSKHVYYKMDASLNWLYSGGTYWTSSTWGGTYGTCPWYYGQNCYSSYCENCMIDSRLWSGADECRPSSVKGIRPVITISKSDL